ncbi:MAG: hypothetical protein J3K34DRAFT_421143 [Monoraphidium minutum]|nr:MAG: hypothetical protein J3K34DRAFT_421143 [Monoraphidium minutum]
MAWRANGGMATMQRPACGTVAGRAPPTVPGQAPASYWGVAEARCMCCACGCVCMWALCEQCVVHACACPAFGGPVKQRAPGPGRERQHLIRTKGVRPSRKGAGAQGPGTEAQSSSSSDLKVGRLAWGAWWREMDGERWEGGRRRRTLAP